MAIRGCLSLVMTFALAGVSSAQFYSYGPRGVVFGPFPPVTAHPSGAVSIRSPFFSMDISPYGGHYRSPYSSFSIPHPGLLPGERAEFFPRGLRDPLYSMPAPEAPSFETFQPFETPSITEPAPVPPPQYDIPKFSDVFPDESTDPTPVSVRIANRIQRATDRLTSSIQLHDTEGVWTNYLRLDDLTQFIARLAESQDLSPQMLSEAESLLVNFDAVLATSDLAWLKSSPGFGDVVAALRDIVQYGAGDSGSNNVDPSAKTTDWPQSPSQEKKTGEGANQFEDLPAPTAKPVNAPLRVFRAEL